VPFVVPGARCGAYVIINWARAWVIVPPVLDSLAIGYGSANRAREAMSMPMQAYISGRKALCCKNQLDGDLP
jgi:hypothetical protein